MISKDRMLAVLLAAWLLLLAGCGGGGSGDSSSTCGNTDDYTLCITVVPDRLNVNSGGSAVIRIALFDSDGQPVSEETVTLTATLGTLGSSTVTTASDGTATTTLTPADSTTVGNSIVTATFGTITVWAEVEFYKPLA